MMRARRPRKYSVVQAQRRLLALLNQTQPGDGAAKIIYDALAKEVEHL